jgi:hypothetical protein|nr:MAG TPA: hypothetical protein [Caudoviricetes sp.]
MYKVIKRPKPAKDLIAFKATANRYFRRGAKYETVKGMEYLYCCMESCGKIHVFKVNQAFKNHTSYNDLQLLKAENIPHENMTNDELYQLALTLI